MASLPRLLPLPAHDYEPTQCIGFGSFQLSRVVTEGDEYINWKQSYNQKQGRKVHDLDDVVIPFPKLILRYRDIVPKPVLMTITAPTGHTGWTRRQLIHIIAKQYFAHASQYRVVRVSAVSSESESGADKASVAVREREREQALLESMEHYSFGQLSWERVPLKNTTQLQQGDVPADFDEFVRDADGNLVYIQQQDAPHTIDCDT